MEESASTMVSAAWRIRADPGSNPGLTLLAFTPSSSMPSYRILHHTIGAVEALTLTTPGSGSKRPRRESGIEPNDLSDRFARGAAQPAAAAPSAGQSSRPGTAPSAPPQRSINAALTQGRDLSATID
ncbi:hypothetical protein THAOC_23628, partial [Thalassiosira oceanica]